MTKKNTTYVIIASFFAMLIMAITESIRGILIPTFKGEFNVNDTQIGIFLFVASLAYVIATIFAGKMVHKFGQKKTIITGMTISGIGFLGTSFSQVFLHLVFGYIVLTIGISFIVMSLNTIVPLLKVSYFGVIMNSLHFFYGVGATITQRLSGYLITNNVSWRHIFIFFAFLYLLGILVYSFVKQPPAKEVNIHKQHIKSFEVPIIVMFSIALGFYVTAEIQTANWLLNYLDEVYSYTADSASFYVAFFFGALSVGRLFGGYILEKIGYLRGIIISLSIAFVLYSIGLLNESTLIYLSISGLFFAVVYPTTVLVLQKFFEDNISKVVTIVTMAASAISMVFGYLIGYLNDHIGVTKSYLLIPASILVSLLFVIGIAINIKHVEKMRHNEEMDIA